MVFNGRIFSFLLVVMLCVTGSFAVAEVPAGYRSGDNGALWEYVAGSSQYHRSQNMDATRPVTKRRKPVKLFTIYYHPPPTDYRGDKKQLLPRSPPTQKVFFP